MEKLAIIVSCFGVARAGSCYYSTGTVGFHYTLYEYCLTGCCGSSCYGCRNECCNDTGAKVGIGISVVLFVAVVVGICIRRRLRRRRMYNLASSGEKDRLVPPPQTNAVPNFPNQTNNSNYGYPGYQYPQGSECIYSRNQNPYQNQGTETKNSGNQYQYLNQGTENQNRYPDQVIGNQYIATGGSHQDASAPPEGQIKQ